MDCNNENVKGFVGYKYPTYACYTSVLKFVPFAGGVCGAATHTVGGDTGYGLLRLLVGLISPFYMIRLSLQFRK